MIAHEKHGSELIVCLSGDIDHCRSKKIREEIENLLSDRQVRSLCLDFTDVSFMDSSGVGMIIGRYKTMMQRNAVIYAQGLFGETERLFRLAGLHRIIPVQNKEGKDNA